MATTSAAALGSQRWVVQVGAAGVVAVGTAAWWLLCGSGNKLRPGNNKKPKKKARLIDGKAIAATIRGEISNEVATFRDRSNGRVPGLAVVLVGDRKDSASYVKTKKKAAKEVGFHSVVVELSSATTQDEIIQTIQRLNNDSEIHAILVQLPLPGHVDEAAVLGEIDVSKDADGFSATNVGRLWLRGGQKPLAVPCTAAACLELLRRCHVQLSGARAVVVGRSNIVGMPAAALLQTADATVTVCHSKTKNIQEIIKLADVIIAAVGIPNYVKGEWLKPGAVVLDVGINAVDDSTRKRGYRLVGDVHFESAEKIAGALTPVPGGVGPMTVAMLLRNTLDLAQMQVLGAKLPSFTDLCALPSEDLRSWRHDENHPRVPSATSAEKAHVNPVGSSKKGHIGQVDESSMMTTPSTPSLQKDTDDVAPVYRRDAIERRRPVPSDIEISQGATPVPIRDVARNAGLLDEETLMYGRHAAKIDAERVHRRLDESVSSRSRRPTTTTRGSLVVVCGVNPTPLGEGKSTTTLGLSQALGSVLRRKVATTIRQPSQGPIFGIKGGAAGGGYAQVVPMDVFNLHLTGDIHAVVAANNLVAAALDARIFHEATQSDEALFNRLCPVTDKKTGVRRLSSLQKKRLFDKVLFSSTTTTGTTTTREERERKASDASLLTADERRALCRLNIDTSTVTWARVVDTCDRFLRKVEIGKGPAEKGMTREARFEIAVASEIMAVLALASDLEDLKLRLGRMAVARDRGRNASNFVTCDDLGVTGALAVLLKDALMPTLMQTLEGTPVLVHCGPFANIAHGNSSVVADALALRLVGENGFVVTEAGFGAEIGGEKNFDIKARAGGKNNQNLAPACVVLVATVRALKAHGSLDTADDDDDATGLSRLARGCANAEHHVRCVTTKFGLRCVVAVNRFKDDTDEEIALVADKCLKAGAFAAVEADHFAQGGPGAADLARAVVRACEEAKSSSFAADDKSSSSSQTTTIATSGVRAAGASDTRASFRFLYPLDAPLKDKILKICQEVYLAADVEYAPAAQEQIEAYERHPVIRRYPICVAKTQYSLTTDPKRKGAPSGHTIFVREIYPKLGAAFLVVVCGDIMLIPGLPTRPGFYDVDLDTETGRVVGLF